MRKVGGVGVAGALSVAVASIGLDAPPARACGGLFCASANPVNQAAEQIVFVDHPDDRVTAIIQIMYEGPAHEFAWVLPVPTVPDVGVSSDQALGAIKQATNPLYQLQRQFTGACSPALSRGTSSPAGAADSAADPRAPGVSVEASGAVGPYEYDVISVDEELDDPADAAITWLDANGYDVGELGPDVLRPYLADDMKLIAFKLRKGNDAGSIRPVIITYQSALPQIPIRPTAVAANDDMGVLVWVLGETRAVPENYKALVLNEALLDWFNPMSNYNDVVIAAADEAMGQGFVTEYAGRHAELGITVFPEWERADWQAFSQAQHQDAATMVLDALNRFGQRDGFDDALRRAVTLPEDLEFQDFRACVRCYAANPGVAIDETAFLTGLYELVIEPLERTQELLDSQPYMTRLYTTLSAEEMTVDPAFVQNPDLDDVSNMHVATQWLDCDGPGWRVELPQGDVVRGYSNGEWPVQSDDAPAALKILQLGTQGQGRVVEDRSRMASDMILERNRRTTDEARAMGLIEDDGCSAAGAPSSRLAWLALPLLALLRRRRRVESL